MMDIGVMIEGQDGLTWSRWSELLRATEQLGFNSLFRSDHFTNPQPPDKESLELWVSLTYAASHSTGIEFGPLVTPVTFRHPVITARTAAAIDDLSGGRLVLGIGAGWNEREHTMFGVPFPGTDTRLSMLDEYVEVVTRLLRSDEPTTFRGRHYSLEEAILLPRPQRSGGPPILIGGNGPRRTLPLAARYADEWNAVIIGPDAMRTLMERLDGLLDEQGRARDAVKRSIMLETLFARDNNALHKKLNDRQMSLDDAVAGGCLCGTPQMWIEQLEAYAAIGVERVMLQWLEQDNLDDLEIVAREVLPAVTASPSPART
ncbi:MAG: LLM class F420-dependent oxidoreductase [Chloroflexota bacterium]